MKKNLLFALCASSLIAVGVGSAFLTSNEGNVLVAKADVNSQFTTYKNSDLGLPHYGDVFTYINPVVNKNTAGTVDLSDKAELKLSYKTGPLSNVSSSYIAVGGYGIYFSNGTVRVLCLKNTSDSDVRTYIKSGLLLKDNNGNSLIDVIDGGYLFSDYVDVTLRVDTSDTYAKIEYYVEYKNVTYYLYEGNTKLGVISANESFVSTITDHKFRYSSAIANNATCLIFRGQEPYGGNSFTNGGQFSYNATSGHVIFDEDCALEGVPSGNDGSVYKISDNTGATTINFDFSNSNITLDDDLRITVRVYTAAIVNGNYPEIRSLDRNDGESWVWFGTGDFRGTAGYTLKTVNNMWHDFVITKSIFSPGKSWTHNFSKSDDPTKLGIVSLYFRHTSSTDVFYIDSVKVDRIGEDFTNHNQFKYSQMSGAGTASLLTYDQVAAENISSGYEGEVLKVQGYVQDTTYIDFIDSKIPLGLVDSIDFRVLGLADSVASRRPEFRLQPYKYADRGLNAWPCVCASGTYQGAGGWSLSEHINEWTTFRADKSILDKNGFDNFADINDPTLLGKFSIIYRCSDKTDTLYIDSIKVNLKPNDGVGPNLIYLGEDTVTIPQHSNPNFNVSAYDEQECRNVDVITTWYPEQSFDAEGKVLNKGAFTVTFESKDYYNNVSTKTINVTVGDEDTEAPIISVPFDSLTLKTGTKFTFDAYRFVSDAYLKSASWTLSTNAVDEYGYLLAGSHTLTIRAEDTAGHVSTKSISLNVVNDYEDSGDIIDEESIANDYRTVETFCITYLRMGEMLPDTDTGYCREHYSDAKNAYLSLTESQKDIFTNSPSFQDMFARLQAWARANGDEFNGISFKNSISSDLIDSMTDTSPIVVAIILITVTTLMFGSYSLLRKNNK